MKIYNEIVIDMNPQSPSFEKVIYEDSFEYSGDIILAQGTEGIPEGTKVAINKGVGDDGKPIYDSYVLQNGEWVIESENTTLVLEAIPKYDSLEEATPKDLQEKGLNKDWRDPRKLGDTGGGMADVTAEEMLDMNEDAMLKWIINTRYGGKLPDNITENDILTQIRTKLPQKGGMETTDWYGLQDTGQKVGGASRSVYGGMGGGMRGQIAGQKQIGKDIYALEEGKGKEWTSKFRTFLSSLPSATGTG